MKDYAVLYKNGKQVQVSFFNRKVLLLFDFFSFFYCLRFDVSRI